MFGSCLKSCMTCAHLFYLPAKASSVDCSHLAQLTRSQFNDTKPFVSTILTIHVQSLFDKAFSTYIPPSTLNELWAKRDFNPNFTFKCKNSNQFQYECSSY